MAIVAVTLFNRLMHDLLEQSGLVRTVRCMTIETVLLNRIIPVGGAEGLNVRLMTGSA